MTIRSLSAFIIGFLVVITVLKPAHAAVCSSAEDCQNKISEYEQKLAQVRTDKTTLSSQIQLMGTKIELAQVRLEKTQADIVKTQTEIDELGNKIERLNESLDHLSGVLLQKIVEGYKRKSASIFELLLSPQATTLTNQMKYIHVAQENDRALAVKTQQVKVNFAEQKDLREEKKSQLETLQNQLEIQKGDLNNQIAQRKTLLEQTKNDEKTYQSLLGQAQAQMSSFKSFVAQSGAGSIISAESFGTGSDGNYYSQRDARWAQATIGGSSETILNVGCLLTSTAMVAKKLGQNSTPLDIASDVSRFFGSTAFMVKPWKSVAGRSYTAVSDIDGELAAGNYVIVGVGRCSSGGSHFVVLTKKEGGTYIMHDPIYGPDKKFSDHYSGICSSATFK